MALTPEGTPYVESTDLVANYPAASLSLANRVDLVGVLPFADAAARTTAIPSPTDGQFTYLQDTNSPEFYNGSAYQALGGKVLQVVSAAKTDIYSTTSTSLSDVTDLSVTITPSSATNKVLIIMHINGAINGSVGGMFFAILRDSTQIALSDAGGSRLRRTFPRLGSSANGYVNGNQSITFLDSPATTSATTYKIQASVTSGSTGYVNRTVDNTDSVNNSWGVSTITVMEVAA
jgi:hypothetical protein